MSGLFGLLGKSENTKTKVISELNTKLQDCVELSKAYELKELEFYKLINLVQEMSNMFENNKTFVDDYIIQMTKTVEEQKNKNNDLNKFYEDKINDLLTRYKINDDQTKNSLNEKKNKQAEALKQQMVDSLNENLRLLTEVTFDTIAESVKQFLDSYVDIVEKFLNRIMREKEVNPTLISWQQEQLRARRDAREHAREQGRRVSPPVGFQDDTDQYEDPPFEYPETDDSDMEYALNFSEKGRGRVGKSRKRNNSTRMFKKHKKQKKQILTTRKRNKRRTSTRRR